MGNDPRTAIIEEKTSYLFNHEQESSTKPYWEYCHYCAVRKDDVIGMTDLEYNTIQQFGKDGWEMIGFQILPGTPYKERIVEYMFKRLRG